MNRLPAAAALVTLLAGLIAAASSQAASPTFTPRAVVPNVAAGDPAPTPVPTPTPRPYEGPVAALRIPAAGVDDRFPVETRDTTYIAGRETFEDPTAPQYIAWYPRFGRPGFPGANSLFAAHIDYIGFGPGPFARLTSVAPGASLEVVMDNGIVYQYTVQSVEVVHLAALDMNAVVFPFVPGDRERITLISCGGTFVPRPGGGGEYDSRVILVAERAIPR
ncbi:MAG: hypothetical protein KatS3mg062_0731 [Tepidiforma sp.]|nr:MAG: hypothetical protein KatS3mg062_0731 [Tepidiforma sp.]